ncbi:MAG TPA: sulfite exporter TauE/SafE family protein [Dehalococcoidales bacterium]
MSGVEITILAATGFFAGVFGTMIGIGGGVIFVPIFLLVFDFTPQQVIGTSLAAVFFNALSGSISYLRQKRVDIKAGWKFAVATLPGAFLGAWLVKYFTSDILETVFGFLLIAVALFIFLRKEPAYMNKGKGKNTRTIIDFRGEAFEYTPREGLGITISFVVGVISSLLGIGGGILHVPALIYLLGFPVHIATATSHFVLAISTFSGSITHLTLGNILFPPAIIVGISAMVGAQIGARLSRRVKGLIIARLLAIALLLVGVRLLLKALGVF